MSVPCTISEAIEISKERRRQDSSDSASRSPVDILAVAVRHSILQSPSAASSSPFPKAEIWITDPSISPTLNVRVTLSGSSAIARVIEDQVASGDILRFNRVSLRYSDDDSFQFVHSWKDPEPGFEWYRLGHVDRSGRFIDRDATRSVPEDMITSLHRMNDIINWCKQQKNGDLSSGLSPLQCQRRSLNEIQFSVGLLSNVVVRITDYDCQRLAQSPAVGSRKRRRSSPAGQTTTGFATLSDGSGTVMSFVDHGSRFASSLRTAKETGKVLMLTNLTSKIGRDIPERALPSDEIVLVPTRATASLLLSNEDLLNYDDHTMTQSYTETQIPISPQSHETIISGIRDIMIDGASIKDGKSLKSLPSFLATFVSPEGNYEGAVIQLLEKVLGSGSSSGIVYADAQVVKTLCGGIEASEIARNEPSLGQHVLELVRALLAEEISLRWTIKVQDKNERYAHVEKVVLPKL